MSSITLTVDTSVTVPPTVVYLDCVEFLWETWRTDLVTRIPFSIEVQPTVDCSVGWFTFIDWSTLVHSFPLPIVSDAKIITELPADHVWSSSRNRNLGELYKAWDLDLCNNQTEITIRYSNGTEIITANALPVKIPEFTICNTAGEPPYPCAIMPLNPYGVRFDHDIYWEFWVETSAGPATGLVRSLDRRVFTCHDQLPHIWTPWSNPIDVMI